MAFWKWWTGVVLIIVSAILLEIFTKSVTYIYINDSSYISLFIFCIFVVVTSIIGYRSFLLQFRNITPTENQMMFPWFAADAVTSMGMIGTIIGFLLVLGGAFADVDPTNVEAMKKGCRKPNQWHGHCFVDYTNWAYYECHNEIPISIIGE